MKRWWAWWALAVLGGCASPPVPTPVGPDHRFVVLGPEGSAVARVVTYAAECPAILLDGVARPMTVRMPAGTMPARASVSPLPPPVPSAFPVTTCEAVVPAGTARATVDGVPLPLPKADPKRIVILGDTGCRVVNGVYQLLQACNDPVEWPFERVAAAAAATKPDLVIHVGDFHYREGPCPAGNAGCAGSPWGYGFDAWRADFFDPGRKLLEAAPWIVVRGNHESCNRAGQGWFRFLDPRPVAAKQDCNDPANDDIGNYSEPYAVPLGSRADTQFLVFDSSWVGLTPLAPTDLMYRNYRAQFASLFGLGARTPHNFLVMHHPVLGYAANPSNPRSPFPGNAGLQSVLSPAYGNVLVPDNVDALLAGHFHVLEVVDFSTPHPPQYVIGQGGDWLDDPLPVPFPSVPGPSPGAVVANLLADSHFGFVTMERAGAGWRLQAFDAAGAPVTTCTLVARRSTCTPLAAVATKP
ncbi:MAG: metallophosphoesterase [Burkholderiales bacterium]